MKIHEFCPPPLDLFVSEVPRRKMRPFKKCRLKDFFKSMFDFSFSIHEMTILWVVILKFDWFVGIIFHFMGKFLGSIIQHYNPLYRSTIIYFIEVL